MKVTAVETIRLGEFPNVLWVRIHADEGLVGLGETFYGVAPVEAHIHETCAPYLLGKDPLEIERHSRNFLNGYLGFKSVGAEMRAASAIDIALWDLFGKACGQPLYQLLGGKCRDRIRVYNTCAGYRYVRAKPVQTTANWGLPAGGKSADRPYEDLDAFLNRADELALSLQGEGYTGMKIWPFDEYAERSNGTRIAPADLKRALVPFEKIRTAVGDDMDIHVEFHSLWDLPTAIEIAQALAPYRPYWFEDPIKMTNLDALADYRRRTNVRVTASETLGTRWAFRELFERQATSVAMLDVAWCGGISRGEEDRRRWPRPITCRSHRTTAPDRSCSPLRCISRSARRTRLSRRSSGRSTPTGTGAGHRAAAARPGLHHRPGGSRAWDRPPAGA